MGILRAIPEIDAWLDKDATSWSVVSELEYKALVRRWSETFAPLVAAHAKCTKGGRDGFASSPASCKCDCDERLASARTL